MEDSSTEENNEQETIEWHRVLDPNELDEGRVTTVAVGRRTFAVSHYDGQYGCIDLSLIHISEPTRPY